MSIHSKEPVVSSGGPVYALYCTACGEYIRTSETRGDPHYLRDHHQSVFECIRALRERIEELEAEANRHFEA